jgi:hypothetical protein
LDRFKQGAVLFRSVGWGVVFVCMLKRSWLASKGKTKEQEARELALSLPLYLEQCKAWVNKVTKATVASILKVRVCGCHRIRHGRMHATANTYSALPSPEP